MNQNQPAQDVEKEITMNLPKTTKKNIFTRILLKCYSKVLNILHWVAHPMNLFQNILYNIMNMSYGYVLFLFTLQFYLFILFFCLLIYLIGLYDKKCIQAGSGSMDDLESSGQIFSVLFTLSWTTFSTVGYGNTWPTLTGNPDNEQHCPAINVLLLVEAFVGVCFAGACGAILFSKVVQVQSQGKVEFSHPITVRFGSGLSDGDEEDEDNDEEDVTPEQGLDCPILEFRVLNQLHSIEDGVITNASVTAAAGIQLNVDETDKANEEVENTKSSIRTSLRTKKEKKKDMVNRVRVAKKFFLDVKFINGEHPNFKRIWTLVHVLNETSPLLTPKMRSLIRKNNGKWPTTKDKYNTAAFIRQNINFSEIIVSFNGVSKHSSCEVKAQKIFNLTDVVIGYQFVDILEKDKANDEVFVKADCLNKVEKQNGPDAGEDLGAIPGKELEG